MICIFRDCKQALHKPECLSWSERSRKCTRDKRKLSEFLWVYVPLVNHLYDYFLFYSISIYFFDHIIFKVKDRTLEIYKVMCRTIHFCMTSYVLRVYQTDSISLDYFPFNYWVFFFFLLLINCAFYIHLYMNCLCNCWLKFIFYVHLQISLFHFMI